MVNKLHHSHDKLFRETWSNLGNARSFLENYLPAPVIELVRLDTLDPSFRKNANKTCFSAIFYGTAIF